MSKELATRDQMAIMASRLNVNQDDLNGIVLNTIMPSKMTPTREQLVTFLAMANEYGLNPMAKEIYAFPAKGGGIQPIVSIDGWLRIINSNPAFDGMEIEFSQTTVKVGGKDVPEFCKCKMYRKDHKQPTEVIEYMTECNRNTEPWKMKPRRMLQHKATIQAARYTFGISGIIDEDEKDAYQEAGVFEPEKDVSPSKVLNEVMNDEPVKGELMPSELEKYMELMNVSTDIRVLQKLYKEGKTKLNDKASLELLAQSKDENKLRIQRAN